MTSVPTYDRFIEPVLRVLARHPDGLKTSEVYTEVADEAGLTDAQRDEILPSGRQPCDTGQAYIAARPGGLSEDEVNGLANVDRIGGSGADAEAPVTSLAKESEAPSSAPFQTPIEAMDWALAELNLSVANELMEFILALTPDQFEVLVLDVLLAMGYGASRRALTRTGGSGDGGIDGIITLDRLGLEKVYIQAKRWAPGNTVGRPELQGFYGALAIRKANKGVFITTSAFTAPAVEYAAQVSDGIVLMDGEMLTQLMIEYGVGVSTQRTVRVVRVDSDYFEGV